MDLFDLSGKVALVTGGNGGIGQGMSVGLAQAGAAIMVAGRNVEKNQAVVAELQAMGAKAASVQVDVTDDGDRRAMVETTVKEFGRLDILVNNAGINIRKQPEDYLMTEWNSVIDTNLSSMFAISQIAYPHICAAGGGKIINIGSMMSLFGAPYAVAYAASKGGVVQLTKALATAWAKDNIQVNSILPGWIDTDLTRRGRENVPELHQHVLDRTPADRWGVIEDMAGIAVFLAASASDFVTGTAIPVDGGFSAQS